MTDRILTAEEEQTLKKYELPPKAEDMIRRVWCAREKAEPNAKAKLFLDLFLFCYFCSTALLWLSICFPENAALGNAVIAGCFFVILAGMHNCLIFLGFLFEISLNEQNAFETYFFPFVRSKKKTKWSYIGSANRILLILGLLAKMQALFLLFLIMYLFVFLMQCILDGHLTEWGKSYVQGLVEEDDEVIVV